MKQFEPIPVYPLNMRGRFGLTRHIYRHGFISVFFYTLLYALLCLALLCLCLLPVALRSFSGVSLYDLAIKAKEFFSSLLQSLSQGPMEFFWSWRSPNDFLPQGGSLIFGVVGSLLLGFLALVFYFFFIKPRYLGTVYNEMGARIYGSSGSVGELSHRGSFCLRRYYSTYLAQIVGKIGADILISFVARAIGLFIAAMAVAASFLSALGGGFAALLGILFSVFLAYFTKTLLTLCFPAAVAEDKREFSALGRGVSLGWKNFGRVFASLLLRELYIALWMLPGSILMSICLFSNTMKAPLLFAALVWIVMVRLYFIPFRLAFDTVLYYDAVARELQSCPPDARKDSAAQVAETSEGTQDTTADDTHNEDAEDINDKETVFEGKEPFAEIKEESKEEE